MELLLRLNREHKLTLVIVTHDAGIAKQAGRVIYLRDGQLEV
jgi:putative ABC transport system ATP-binding protein